MKILVTGAVGQIGSELTLELRKRYGANNVIATMHRTPPSDELKESGPIEKVDVTDKEAVRKLIKKHKIDTIYHLVGILSAVGEKKPDLAWHINMNSLKNVLDLAVEYKIKKVFWPSSIAAFGPTTPRVKTPQRTVLEPTTMYGLTKVAGELLCNYYFEKYGLDVRSLRYPGVISWKTAPGGGTTDYAVAIFYEALEKKSYEFFVSKNTVLPMMYMDDAVKATCDLMSAPSKNISVRTSYNLTALSFSAEEIAKEVQKHIPDLKVTYKPDFRQKIADSWPQSIDDSQARKDWGWKPEFTLAKMTKDMLDNLSAECNRF
jgi:nucleoside-diphosphate-sugar epimerase